MNYRHLYHAGNFADIFKHVVLVAIIEYLLKKDKSFCYIDTHAGIGRYDLYSTAAKKTREFQSGIARLFCIQKKPTPTIQNFLSIVQSFNSQQQLRFYPGSPCIAKYLLRDHDKMILIELHPEDLQTLKQEFLGHKQAAVHFMDGYQGLKAFIPPTPRRGIVFVDPSYEQVDEFSKILQHLTLAYQRWPNGIYAIWYPIKNNRSEINKFHRLLKNIPANILFAELNIFPDDSPLKLNGSGMIIINPPYKLDQNLAKTISWLAQVLGNDKESHWQIKWLARR
jgi:23S rRNA (adenine2030-N6)-methyltransferase